MNDNPKPAWETKLDSFDRAVRRSNQRQNNRCVSLSGDLIELIRDDYTIPSLTILNNLTEKQENET